MAETNLIECLGCGQRTQFDSPKESSKIEFLCKECGSTKWFSVNISLDLEDWERLIDIIENPPEPTQDLLDLMKEYKEKYEIS